MNILTALASGPNAFRGEGVNEEKEAFVGELSVTPLEGGRAVLLSYVATLPTGTVVHTESSLLGTGPNGKLCLWPVMSEVPVVLPHPELLADAKSEAEFKTVFGSGPRTEVTSFREEITIQINSDRSLVYAHAWGLPGGAFEDRSSCRMVPREA
jgi:hypothetical protein